MENIDGEGPQLKKRKRIFLTPPNLQITECVREFKLPQAYPSMVSQTKKNPVNVTVERIMVPGGQSTLNLKVNSGKIDPNNKLQKLKLKAPDGRDLGEFDVQVLPQASKDTRTVSVMANQLGKKSETRIIKTDDAKISTLNVPPTETMKNFTKSPITSLKYIKKPVEKSKTTDRTSTTHGVLIPISPVLINQKNYSDKNLPTVIDDSGKNSKVYVVQAGNNWQMVKQINDKKKILDSVNSTSLKLNGLECNVKTLIKPVPAGMKVKLINGNFKQNAEILLERRKRPQSSDKLGNPGKKLALSPLPMNSLINSNGFVKIENLEKGNFGKNTYYVLPSESVIPSHESFDKNISINIPEKLENSRQSFTLKNSLGRVNLIRTEKKNFNTPKKNECDSSNDSSFINSTCEKNDGKPLGNNLDELNILGKAINSLSDEEMRRKALKALRECGIGLENLVPKKLPLDKICIRESQTQTPVFGMLCADEFVELSEDYLTLNTIPVKQRQTVMNSESKKDFFSAQDLDTMLDQWNADTERVKQIQNMMKYNPLTCKIYDLLEKDFSNAKIYDENGYLNIHKAVLKNHVMAVRRQITILNACKISVDIPTKSNQTSLELAMKYTECETIIRLLLKAGANPTSSKLAHDSALTIASKHSSPLLPLLIKHVSASKDLNYVDSSGFAAIHYCAQSGNIAGIMALIAANADINVRDSKSGRTALFHALENDDLKLAKELLCHGAKPNIPNFSSQTVFHLIDDSKHISLKDMLTKAMKM